MNFATNFVADRNKIIYKTTVDPDLVSYLPDDFDNLEKDEKIKLALQCLLKMAVIDDAEK